jgi:hypothetical protein
MATITSADLDTLYSQTLYRPGQGKEELKALAALPNKTQLVAAFQVIETFWETNKAAVKADIDTALGVTTSAALARKIGLAWLLWKVARGNT